MFQILKFTDITCYCIWVPRIYEYKVKMASIPQHYIL